MQLYKGYIPALVFLLVVSCKSSDHHYDYTPDGVTANYHEINAQIEEDEQIMKLLAPYTRDIESSMNRVLTLSEGAFERARPEGTLGNLTADIIRYRATAEMRETVHVSVMNNSGLRMPIPEGEITVRHIYELMPFESYITVLKFTGEQLIRITEELAVANGEPVSGLRFRIVDDAARDILVNFRNVEPDSHYWVATSNWMADGGGSIPTLWDPIERINLDIHIREAFKDFLIGFQSISPYLDQRVRN